MRKRANKAKLVKQLSIVLLAIWCSKIAFSQTLGSSLQTNFLTEIDETKSSPKTRITIADELQFKPGTQLDENNYSASAEYWNETSWGIAGSIEINDLQIINLPKNSSFRNFDVKKKLFSSQKETSYLALGLGWQDINYGDSIDAEGINFSLLGELSLTNNLLVYGKGSIFEGLNTDYSVSGYRFETGVTYKTGKQFSFSVLSPELTPDLSKDNQHILNAAVSLVFSTSNNSIQLLFIKRAKHPKDPWSGHIAFPGGGYESEDKNSLRNTAIRETKEELGVELNKASYVGCINPVSGPVISNNKTVRIAPHIFIVDEQPELMPNYEVDHGFWIPLEMLVREDNIQTFRHPTVKGYQMNGIDLGLQSGTLLWGLSLDILYRLFHAVELTVEQKLTSFQKLT